MKKTIGTIAAGVLFVSGGCGLVVTTSMSSKGLSANWPDIPNIWLAGVAVAIFAVGLVMVAAHLFYEVRWTLQRFWKDPHFFGALIATAVGAGVIWGEFQINHMATDFSSHKEKSEGVSAVAEYNVAAKRQPQIELDIAKLEKDRDTVKNATTPAEITAAQRLMSFYSKDGKPYYEGPIDGKEEGLTKAALRGFGVYAQEKMDALTKERAAVDAVVAKGKPEPRATQTLDDNSRYVALAITLLVAFAFALGEIILRMTWHQAEEDPRDMMDAADEMEVGLHLIGKETNVHTFSRDVLKRARRLR